MANKVKLGSIGLGWWGGVLAEGAVASGQAELVSCFARSSDRRARFAEIHGCKPEQSLEEILHDPGIDGVLIATPHTTHAELAIAAAESGKHVFIDKPLTLSVTTADNVISAAEKADVVLQVGHNRRRQPANRRIRDMIAAGDLGSLHHLHANHSAPLFHNPDLPAWRRRPEENPVGGMTALGVHQVDTFQYLAGPIARVAAVSTRLLTNGVVDDTTAITFVFESGAIGQLVTSLATGPAVDVQIHGTEGSARNFGDGASLTFQKRGSTNRDVIELELLDTIADELAEFCRATKGEVEPETGGSEGRSVVAVLEAIIESVARKQVVEVAR